jgi:C-terminal processing protease CtpA/Prc
MAQTSEDEPSFRAVSEAISYLRLPTFNKLNGERLRALLAGLPKSAGSEKLLIVDLRGNGGATTRWTN